MLLCDGAHGLVPTGTQSLSLRARASQLQTSFPLCQGLGQVVKQLIAPRCNFHTEILLEYLVFHLLHLSSCVSKGQATQQNQQLIAASHKTHGLEEKRRNEAEEKAAETAKLVAEAAAKAKTADPFSGCHSSDGVVFVYFF